jgi:hypothetical protein
MLEVVHYVKRDLTERLTFVAVAGRREVLVAALLHLHLDLDLDLDQSLQPHSMYALLAHNLI